MEKVYDKKCFRCHKPLGPLDVFEQVRTGEHLGKWQHTQDPCPPSATVTGEPAFPFLSQNTTSTGGMPHKQHRERRTQLPPKRS